MDVLNTVIAKLKTLTPLEAGGVLLVAYLIRLGYISLTTTRTTPLRGPKPDNWLWGWQRKLFAGDSAAMFEEWYEEFGPVYEVTGSMGKKRVIIADPKAVAHFYAHETFTYQQNPFARHFLANLVRPLIIQSSGKC